MITGTVLFLMLMACAWVAYRNQFWDTRTVRFLAFFKRKNPPTDCCPEAKPIWKKRRLTWEFPENL